MNNPASTAKFESVIRSTVLPLSFHSKLDFAESFRSLGLVQRMSHNINYHWPAFKDFARQLELPGGSDQRCMKGKLIIRAEKECNVSLSKTRLRETPFSWRNMLILSSL